MQRYRVNLPLLISLAVVALVLTFGSFFLWKFQAERNADRLLDRAEVARDAGDITKCVSLLAQYTSLRPDDEDAAANLATTYSELIDDPEIEQAEVQRILYRFESTVRAQPDNTELRRSLVDLLMRVGWHTQAVDHIGQLLNHTPGDPELELLRSRCLFSTKDPKALEHGYRLIGFNDSLETFDDSKAIAPNESIVYARIANELRVENNNDELAGKILDQMIKLNPEDAQAYLQRGRFYAVTDKEKSKADIEAALKIDPSDPAAVVANAQLYSADEDFDTARKLIEAGIEKTSDSPVLYQALAHIERVDNDYEGALAVYDRGIEAVPAQQGSTLQFLRASLLVEQKKMDEAKIAIEEMRASRGINPNQIAYLEARLKMAENGWFEAAAQFEKLKGAFAKNASLTAQLNFFLGFCYEKMGQTEKALESYEVSLQTDSNYQVSAWGRSRMLTQLGRNVQDKGSTGIFATLAKEIAKPKSRQDWDTFDLLIDKYVKQRNLSDAMRAVLEAEVFMKREKYPEARAKLIDSYHLDPKNIGVRRAAVKLFAADPGQGAVKALSLLDKVVNDFGDMPILRLDRSDLLITIGDEDLSEQLFELTKNIDQMETDQKIQLWEGMARRFQRIRDRESQQYCLLKVADLSPSQLPVLINLMLMASQANDEVGMQDAQDRILKVVGSKDDATWIFAEAHRLVTQYRTQSQDPATLEKAKQLVTQALEARPEWHQLYLLQANINLLSNDATAALRSLDRASELGRPTALSLFQHAKLLMQFGRFSEVLEVIEKMSPQVRVRLLGREYAESLYRVGRVPEALAAASDFAVEGPNNGDVQFWYGKFLQKLALQKGLEKEQRDSLLSKAGEALEKAIEQKANSADVWLSLISHGVASGNVEEAEENIRKAQIQLVEDENQLLFARAYELIGRWFDAEALYKQAAHDAVGANNQNRTTRLLARYYLSPSYPMNDRKIEKATPLINQLLKRVADGELDQQDDNARWAVSTTARLLAAKGEYQKLLDAERVLSSNAVSGTLRNEDRLLMAEILSPRPEPVSRLKAARLFEQIRTSQPLTLKAELTLGKLYFALGDWRKCREQMIDTIARFSKEPAVRVTYIQMLLDRGGPTELDTAVRQLKRLRDMAPNNVKTRELIARVAMKRGKREAATAALKGLLPRDLKNLTPEQLPMVQHVAALLISFEDYRAAGSLLKLSASAGGEREKIQFAQYVGAYVDAEQGLADLRSISNDAGDIRIIGGGIAILRKRVETEGPVDAQFDIVAKWIQRGLREDPESIRMLSYKAELLDLRQNYPEAIEIYREVLKSDQVQGIQRAVVLNNLAYMMALSSSSEQAVEEATGYVQDAIDIIGPRSDVLDTRAVIEIAAGDFEKAILDLDLAVTDLPTASKYFHKAVAHFRAEEKTQAAQAWKKSIELGLDSSKISPLEKAMFNEMQEGLGQEG